MDLYALMREIQQGDREAFATLYTRYNKTVYRIALERTKNTDAAVQIVKAVFREMYQTIRSKGPYMGDLNGWLDALTEKYVFAMADNHSPVQAARHYTNEEAQRITQRADAALSFSPERQEGAERSANGITVCGLVLLAAGLLWVLVGLLGTLEVLPQWDFGYNWFNQTLFPLF